MMKYVVNSFGTIKEFETMDEMVDKLARCARRQFRFQLENFGQWFDDSPRCSFWFVFDVPINNKTLKGFITFWLSDSREYCSDILHSITYSEDKI